MKLSCARKVWHFSWMYSETKLSTFISQNYESILCVTCCRFTVAQVFSLLQPSIWGFPDSSVGKESACNAGDPGSIPWLGRSPGEVKGQFSSVQFSHSVMSDSLGPHESQHARPPCPSPTLGVHPNSCPCPVGDAIQPSHPLSSLSPPALILSQHQGLFK